MPDAQRERRRAPRALADFPIEIAAKAGARAARLKDISEIGLCCQFGEHVDEMTLVAIDLKLPGSGQHLVKGAVVRCDTGPRGDYEVAIYFTEIAPHTKAALKDLVAVGRPA